ncbi:MAG: HK97 gp10 family phage protein [Thermoleophilia bacterium]|nr:HK97 gp10 family phage protein [Thermoleophilia bacterium]
MTHVLEIPVTLEVQGIDPSAFVWAMHIFREELTEACRDIGLHVSERVKRIIVEDKIWYTGTLLNSITWSLIEETAATIGVAVGTNVEYARWVEYGTVPHFVPFHMAKTLYDQALHQWGWIVPKARNVPVTRPSKAVSAGPGGYTMITGKHQTYLTKHPERLWLQKDAKSRPAWGVFVSGEPQPFFWPGWEQSVAWVERRLLRACDTAAQRISAGG